MHDDTQQAALEHGVDLGQFPAIASAYGPEATTEEGAITPSGWPAAVAVRPEKWNLKVVPATYMTTSGDTYSGLAATYLGAPQRWKEIWDLNKSDPKMMNPDVLGVAWVLKMPKEASDNMSAWIALGQPSTKPGELPPTEKRKAAVKLTARKLGVPIAIAGVAAVVAYFVFR